MKIFTENGVTAMVLTKTQDNSDEKYLLKALWDIETNKIQLLIINNFSFTRKSFETKKGRFVRSRFTNYMPWAYHCDIMHELANLKY